MIFEGMLGEQPYSVRLLGLADLPLIDSLQQEVCTALADPNILQPLSEDELVNILGGNGLMVGAFTGERLIAFRGLLQPEADEEGHLGLDVGASDLSRVLYQEISNVHPDFRGFGLQKVLARIVMEQVDVERFDWVCATVMPYNIASLKDKFAQNMYVYALKLKYGGKLRYVFGKLLNGEEPTIEESAVTVSMGDTKVQQQLLKDGYIGISMQAAGYDWIVEYRK